MKLRWGPYVKDLEVRVADGPESLLHNKLQPDSITLHVECHPPMIVTFGLGPSPDPRPRAIPSDEGWTRAAGMPVDAPQPLLIEPTPTDPDELADLLDPREDPPSSESA